MVNTPPVAEDTPSRKPPTLAQRYADAVWAADSDELTQAEMVMALCYANHAHKPSHDRAWVTDRRLMQQCKIRSAGTVGRVRDSVVKKGWLIPLHPETSVPLSEAERKEMRRKTITYRLAIPASAPIIGAEDARATPATAAGESTGTAPMTGAATSMVEVAGDADAAPMVEESAPMVDVRCSDDRSPLSYDPLTNSLLGAPDRQAAPAVVSTVEEREDHQEENPTPTPPPKVPGVSADLVERVMAKTTATAAEFVAVIEAARRAGVHSPGPWLRSKAGAENFLERLAALRAAPSAAKSGPPGVGDYRQAIRAACEEHGTPGGSARCALCRTQAQVQPPVAEDRGAEVPTPRGDQPTAAPERDRSEPPTTPGADTSIADARAQLAKLSTKPIRRRTTPTRLQPSPTETPTAVTAAHTYLNSCGDGLEWVETAREKLGGPTADRDEVMVLAMTLAHEHHDRIPAHS